MKLAIQRPVSAALWLTGCIAWISMNVLSGAQGFTTTTVQGTVYLANGQPGAGSLQLSWPAFTTGSNQAVAAGRTNVQIGADGFVSVRLAPNLGSSPAGLYYTAVYHLSDGTTSTEYRQLDPAELLRVFDCLVYQPAGRQCTVNGAQSRMW